MSIITITGDLASGKSLVAKKIAAELGAVYFSTGQIQREIAAKYGMTTLELNRYSETHPEIDREIDDRVKMLGESDNDLVVDSRMAWHFLPQSFKVYLSTNIVRAAERVIADNERSNEPVYRDRNDAMLKLRERKHSENKRYLQLYQADCSKLSNFDIVVDTTYSVPGDILRTVIAGFGDWRRNVPQHRYWYSPCSILPLRFLRDLDTDSLRDTREPVKAVMSDGNLYAYAGHDRLANAIRKKLPHLPVDIVAVDDENLPGGRTAAQYVDDADCANIIPEWEREFGFNYLAISGPFRERAD